MELSKKKSGEKTKRRTHGFTFSQRVAFGCKQTRGDSWRTALLPLDARPSRTRTSAVSLKRPWAGSKLDRQPAPSEHDEAKRGATEALPPVLVEHELALPLLPDQGRLLHPERRDRPVNVLVA